MTYSGITYGELGNFWKNTEVSEQNIKDYLKTQVDTSNDITLQTGLNAINALSSDPAYEILKDTGLALESRREDLADLARSDYDAYVAEKKKYRNQVKSEVLRSYTVTYASFKKIGYPDNICKARALEAALATQKIQSEVFQSVFKNMGKPVQDVY